VLPTLVVAASVYITQRTEQIKFAKVGTKECDDNTMESSWKVVNTGMQYHYGKDDDSMCEK